MRHTIPESAAGGMWETINSPIILWLLSGVLAALVGTFVSYYNESHKRWLDQKELVSKLKQEIPHFVGDLVIMISEFDRGVKSPEEFFNQFYTNRLISNGNEVYPEFSKRSLFSLLVQLKSNWYEDAGKEDIEAALLTAGRLERQFLEEYYKIRKMSADEQRVAVAQFISQEAMPGLLSIQSVFSKSVAHPADAPSPPGPGTKPDTKSVPNQPNAGRYPISAPSETTVPRRRPDACVDGSADRVGSSGIFRIRRADTGDATLKTLRLRRERRRLRSAAI